MDGLVQDLRYALRKLRKSPGFTIAAVLTLALGIGANAVVFSVLNTLVLRPVNVPGGQNLYQLEWPEGIPAVSYPDYLDLRDRNHSFDGLIAYEMSTAGLDSDGKPRAVWLYTASGNYFDVLGVRPYLGRFFHSSDEHGPNSAPYLVLSYGYWKSHFQGDPGVVDRVVRLNKYNFTILGVAPQGFRGTELFYSPDLWAPIVNQEQIEGSSDLEARSNRGRWVVGSLKRGVTPEQATADVKSIAAYLAKTYPKDDDGIQFALTRPGLAGDMLGRPVHAFVAGLLVLTALILIAACVNLGSLFAARAADRTREFAVRLALGSKRARILRQLLAEAIFIALAAGVLASLASSVPLRAFSAWNPDPVFPINLQILPDSRTYMAALVLALASAFLFAMAPLRQIFKTDPSQGIRSGSSGSANPRRITLRDLLLAGQIAVCAVLVTSSLVAVRGMIRSLHANLGFLPQHALQVNTDLDMGGYKSAQAVEMQKRMLDAVKNLPGVTAAAYAGRIPLNIGWSEGAVFRDNTTDYRMSNAAASPLVYSVSPGYFRAAGTALLEGRDFTWEDKADAPRVVVVNRELAREVFGSDGNPVGRWFKSEDGTRVQVVGIVEDGKYKTLSEDAQAAMFLPILQSPSTWTWIIIRSSGGVTDLVPEVERTLHSLDASLCWRSQASLAWLRTR
jgi:macrolide transport system ATP-binding/permease protein